MASSTIESLKRRQRIFIIVAVLLGIIGLAFVIHGVFIFGLSNSDNLNLLGDYLGGTTGSFWSAAGLIVVYLAFIAQRLQLEMQNEQINETRAGLEQQIFENTFFSLLKLHSSTVSDIDMLVAEKPIKGKDCIRVIMNDLKSAFNNSDGDTKEERVIFAIKGILARHSLDISTYFNSLYSIIRLVEGKDGERYDYYSSILTSQLSSYEMALLYYYSLVDNKFQSFVKRNNIMEDVKKSPNNKALLFE